MYLPLTLDIVAATVLDTASSTNDVVIGRGAEALHFDTVLTTTQTSGRGRLGRSWSAPPSTSLAVSVMIRPRGLHGAPVDMQTWGWLPLLAGLAMSRAVTALLPGRPVGLKWPNDVLVGSKKVSGILSELVPDASGVVVGAGLNLSIAESDLPTALATSLTLEGCELRDDALVDAACSSYLTQFRSLVDTFLAADGDTETTGLRTATHRACTTIGRSVRVQLPTRPDLIGVAQTLDSLGRLVVRATDGSTHPIAAGDVTHLRPIDIIGDGDQPR